MPMTEPQKVSRCKFCSQEITWHKDAVTGKNYPKNLNGSPHLCKSSAPAQEKTPAQIAQEREEYNRKAQAAGFQTGAQVKQQEEKAPCTSPNTPAATPANGSGIKTVEGQIVEINHDAHKITVKDRTGALHTMIWPPVLVDQMSKLKQWWFTKITGEHQADVDLWKLTANEFFKRPEDWPFKPAGGKGGYAPRNEKMIVVQTMLKAYCDLWCSTNTPDQVTFADAREDILAAIEADLPRILKAGGVQ
jgi:hypothetical protein